MKNTSDEKSNLSNKLKEIRKSLRLSQGELAELVGISQTQVSKIELGKNDTSLFVLKKICLTCNVDPLDLIFLPEEKDELLKTIRLNDNLNATVKPYILQPTIREVKQGTTFINGMALDTLANHLRDRIKLERDETDDVTLNSVKESLHQGLRFLDNSKIANKTA
ncbi:MAG: helix-turn-helix transcriptional regulator [Cloacibacillus porcorum]|uniref:helix-turn-helix transcriptional regulator n=1 Tax=Cloacibacillus porcorum TaxID=1197717 RepID=UPI0023F2D229|nr:helix-turn-helix transcriptional regulator [Cloacibacillus porcorum]MCD7876216.1 helix-turn-helix transcriptional regulator [Cloacibacillus porcorum]